MTQDIPSVPLSEAAPQREAIARIIAPTAFKLADELARPGSEGFQDYREAMAKANEQTGIAITKADAILALQRSLPGGKFDDGYASFGDGPSQDAMN